MSEHYDFHYQPTGSGAISGQQVLQQTEDAINELGDYVNDNVGGAMDVAQQALETAQNAEQDAQTALDTANSFSDAIQSAQQDASTALSTAQTAQTTASNANNTAIQAQQDASSAVTTANNASRQVSTLSGTVTALGQRVTTAEGNISQNTNDITALTTRVGTAEGNITTLQNDVTIAQGNASSAMATAGQVKQQAYVFRYSSTVLTPSSTNSNALLDNTDNLKVGDKVIDSSGVLFSITAIDTQNSTFTIGTALIDLAQDSDVVHKSGDETVGGEKTFQQRPIIFNSNATVQADVPNLMFKNPLVERASTTLDGEQTILFTDKNASNIASIQAKTYTSGTSDIILTSYSETDNQAVRTTGIVIRRTPTTSKFHGYSDNITSLGDTNRRWTKVYAMNYYYGNDNIEFSTKFVTTDTAQTIAGNKTFASNVNVYNSDNTATTPNFTLRSSKSAIGTSDTDVQTIFFSDKNGTSLASVKAQNFTSNGATYLLNSVNTKDTNDQIIEASTSLYILNNGRKVFRPNTDNEIFLGYSLQKWKDFYTYLINGLEPSSLSLPDIANKIDISSYITDLTGAPNQYISPSNGYINLRSTNADILGIVENTSGMGTISRGNNQTIAVYLPVVANSSISLYAKCTSLAQAYFIPCQGNV